MLRIVRLVRMVRIVKLFKHYRLWLNESRIIRGWSQENSDDRLPTRHSRDLYLGNEESNIQMMNQVEITRNCLHQLRNELLHWFF